MTDDAFREVGRKVPDDELGAFFRQWLAREFGTRVLSEHLKLSLWQGWIEAFSRGLFTSTPQGALRSPTYLKVVEAVRSSTKTTYDNATQVGLFAGSCCRCGQVETTDPFGGVYKVEWQCAVCNKLVCRNCTLTIPESIPVEYWHTTYCSAACHAAAPARFRQDDERMRS